MIQIPNLLLVSGSNRNVGKTTFICKVISLFSNYSIIGVKVTPHFHNSRESKKVLFDSNVVFMAEELDDFSNKDSSLMLQSGAEKVIYVEQKEDSFSEIVEYIKNIPAHLPIICESASMRKFVKPGLMIMIDNPEVFEKKPIFYELTNQIDLLISTNNSIFDFDINRLRFEEGMWRL